MTAESSRTTSEVNAGLGWMLLPGAEICSSGGCKRTDSSFLFNLIGRLHFQQKWALGAGAHFALWPTTNPPLSSEANAEHRSLARSYLAVTAQVLYFPGRMSAQGPAVGKLDYYVGGDLGVALLSDRYSSPPFDESGALRLGEPGAVVKSQGAIGRLLLGADLGISAHMALGLSGQFGGLWFPREKATVFGDPSSLQKPAIWSSATFEVKVFWGL